MKGSIMQSIQSDSKGLPLPMDGNTSQSAASNYEAVRFNALKHGILSRLVVLAHEDGAEFADLLAALIDEHQPAGLTERHLIEKLATIIWRKRRVLLAEGAKINQGLKSSARNAESVIQSAVPFEQGLSGKGTDIRDLVGLTPEEIAQRYRDAELDLAATQKAAAILRKGGANAYEKARRALIPETRDWWDDRVADEEHPASAEGLAEFIRKTLEPICWQIATEAQFTPAIKAQTLGEGLRAHLLENLNRYETHLDRKFERTLAMLLKLKDLRGACNATS